MKKTLILLNLVFLSTVAAGQLPARFSWQEKYVSPVNDQLRLGPCYTFAAVGGVETMHHLYFGTGAIDLSERQVYSCGAPSGVAAIETALQYISVNGVTTAACIPYPSGSNVTCNEYSDNGQYTIVLRPCSELQQQLDNCSFKKRVKATYQQVTNDMKLGDEAIKSMLVTNGPIMLSFETPQLHQSGIHGYLLYGWETIGGTLKWLLRDSWPCESGNIQAAVNLPAIFNSNSNSRAFVINSVTEERYSNGWYNVNLPIVPFELDSVNQIVKINSPSGSCANQGTYTLRNLDKIPGAVLEGWTLRTSYDYPNYGASITPSGYLSGHAAGVTVVAIIRRANGLREYITKPIGNVGVPLRVDKRADWCPTTGTREIHLFANSLTPPNCTCTTTMSFPPISNGYVINYGYFAVFVSTVTQSVNYSVQVTCQKTNAPGCTVTNSMNTYVLALPCNSYYGAAMRQGDTDEDSEATGETDYSDGVSVFPNPAENKLIIDSKDPACNDVRIIDALGHVVHTGQVAGHTEIEIGNLSRGIHVVELVSKEKKIKRVKVIFK